MQSLIMEPEPKPQRMEPLKFLPVVFMFATILFLYVAYVVQHCIPRPQLDVDPKLVDKDIRARGQLELTVFHWVTALMTVCYVRAMFTSPGTIPSDDKNWEYQEDYFSFLPSFLKETKRSGDRRHCKWCSKFKPDRTHHCRVCRQCTLKMDHHCPWIYNCVGYFNYKWFFLLLFYCMINLHLITWTMVETVWRVVEVPTPLFAMFIVFFTETLAAFMTLLVTLFFFFHCYLVVNGMSTIEFCEKVMPKGEVNEIPENVYDLGLYGNISAVLGDKALLWLLPVNGPPGDGLTFLSATEKVAYDDLEATKTVLRKGNKGRPRQERGICGGADGEGVC
ncbi:unnamed protein product [Durusdinium trenchii]|uniref:Palmitoyltransferase n=1 Tax=Durusdinium trenchii TaxID=1381693 RepID=A0ABP0PSE7_9DINO